MNQNHVAWRHHQYKQISNHVIAIFLYHAFAKQFFLYVPGIQIDTLPICCYMAQLVPHALIYSTTTVE